MPGSGVVRRLADADAPPRHAWRRWRALQKWRARPPLTAQPCDRRRLGLSPIRGAREARLINQMLDPRLEPASALERAGIAKSILKRSRCPADRADRAFNFARAGDLHHGRAAQRADQFDQGTFDRHTVREAQAPIASHKPRRDRRIRRAMLSPTAVGATKRDRFPRYSTMPDCRSSLIERFCPPLKDSQGQICKCEFQMTQSTANCCWVNAFMVGTPAPEALERFPVTLPTGTSLERKIG
jgi:hypothetical protein